VKRRLLLDVEVVEFLERLDNPKCTAIWKRLREIAAAPDRFIDYQEQDECGRDLAVHLFQGHAILYWDDFADRHLKVLEITSADAFPSDASDDNR
jgi:hypothetical protein